MILFPIRTVSRANVREHRWARISRTKAERETALLIARNHLIMHNIRVAKVTQIRMVRLGVKLLDDDNLPGAMKAVQDGLCRALGVDDGPRALTGIRWEYGQRQVKREYTGVEAVVEYEGSAKVDQCSSPI